MCRDWGVNEVGMQESEGQAQGNRGIDSGKARVDEGSTTRWVDECWTRSTEGRRRMAGWRGATHLAGRCHEPALRSTIESAISCAQHAARA